MLLGDIFFQSWTLNLLVNCIQEGI